MGFDKTSEVFDQVNEFQVVKSPSTSRMSTTLQGERTLFGLVPEKYVCFLIDTSGSMYHQLDFVKMHLIELLARRAKTLQDFMFNMIQFKEDTVKWENRLVSCTPETVNAAAKWINTLKCGTSTDTMTALLQAFNDSKTEAVYMVTDGPPDQRPAIILETLKSITCNIPVHCIYLKGTYSEPTACGFLKDLAEQTGGSLHTVTLSHQGKVQQVEPIYTNSKATHFQYYEDQVSFPREGTRYFDLSNPSTSSYINRSNDNPMELQTDGYYNHLVPHPPLTRKVSPLQYSCSNSFDSNVLDYADAVLKARGVAQSAGIRCSSTPVASSVMNGVKVLARHDRDGLYYMGKVQKQGPNESFFIKFDSCSAMKKTVLRETSVQNLIAYKDAIRLNISLGDKVLAPWQQDGRYGPGTVLDGFERRDTQNDENDEGGCQLLVNFFNGQTLLLPRDVAVRIPGKKFDCISRDLQLPESQRRKQTLQEEPCSPVSRYDPSLRPKPKTVWEEEKLELENDMLKQKIDEQMRENSNLLRALDLKHSDAKTLRDSRMIGRATTRDLVHENVTRSMESPVIGKATSRELLRDYDSGVFSDEDSGDYSEEDTTTTFSEPPLFDHDDGIPAYRKEYDLAYTPRFSLPVQEQSSSIERSKRWHSKSEGDVQLAKRWQYSGTNASAKQPARFRETMLKKPREPGEKFSERPTHQEYQTVAGVSFPAGTDRKFGAKPQKWHPYRQFEVGKSKSRENISAIWERKHLKHSEYQDASGVKFPSSTDKKFTRSLDPNWSPDTALRNAERSRNWEDGLGHGDAVKNARYANKLERIRSNKRVYFKDIEDKVAIEEGKEAKKIEFRRNKTTERKEDMAEADAEANRLKTIRMETKRAKQAEIVKHEKDRTEKAEKWKTDRIEAMKERQVKFADIEESHETNHDSRIARRQAFLRMKENERREQFHDRLREEWRTDDERAEHLRRKSEACQEKQNIRSREAERKKEARLSAKQNKMEKYRASILP